ncbi:ABC transporter substrate-binding protein [Mesorhizobium sp. LHD-90]|uniref:ABC transporter substrate-binding protein n=1 Tax=Mesorhizobium sp. LHD-90 TaxID=3071414 RepID=UPI0027DF6D7D|nr:ABC transporter substrate-binding protein [Mesorhizobium sp. LHD-90]MDQ6432538.1 ABC transporter substrate-binding protein [Mesorhizobium sp. LHD-90]
MIANAVSRRTFLKGAAAGSSVFLASGLPVFAQSATKLVFMEPFDLALEYAQEMNAIVGGHFGKEGLDVSITNVRGTAVGIQQVIATQANTTRIGLLDLLKAAGSQEAKIVSVATSLQGGIFNLVSRKDAPINSPADLKGKVVGVASLGGGQENVLNLMLSSAGIKPEEVERQAIGSNAGNVEILKQGRVDAFIASTETALILQMNNEPVEIWSTSKFAPLPGGVIMMTDEFAQANRETVVRFLRAMRASALEIIDTDPAVILDRIVGEFDITTNEDRQFRLNAIKAYNDLTLAQGRENVMRNVPSVFEAVAKLVNDAGIVTVPDAAALYDNSFADEAFK